MRSLLNKSRPPVFCSGCSHERVLHALDQALCNMKLKGNQVALVSDIGCSGLFDTFFHTHALHGLHGRCLIYATGLKLGHPELNVVVTMGDGGLGIGGAHFLSACRRNLDLTLIVLNNFNFGMTGGQFSPTTPQNARVGSGFLNQLDRPMDLCQVAVSAGAPFVSRLSSYSKNLAEEIEKGIRYKGFSVLDLWGICTGRYTKNNRLTPRTIDKIIASMPACNGEVAVNVRKEYGEHYREKAAAQKEIRSLTRIEPRFRAPETERKEVVLLGSAGQRIITAGEILCFAGLLAGWRVTEKTDYDITVLRGPSISELILSPDEIGYTGVEAPDVILALGQEGVDRRRYLFDHLTPESLILQAQDVEMPASSGRIYRIDFEQQRIRRADRALASLAVLAKLNKVVSHEMLRSALESRFRGQMLTSTLALVDRVETHR